MSTRPPDFPPEWTPRRTDEEIGEVARAFEEGGVPWARFSWPWQMAVAVWLVRNRVDARARYVEGWRRMLLPDKAIWFDATFYAGRVDGLDPGEGSIAARVTTLGAARGLRDEAAIGALVADWEAGVLPLPAWGHPEHLTVATEYLRRHGREAGTSRFRDGVRAFNARHGLDGYHETLTLALIALIERFRAEHDRGQPLSEMLPALFARLCDKKALLRHYSPERLGSREARAAWIEPDREPL